MSESSWLHKVQDEQRILCEFTFRWISVQVNCRRRNRYIYMTDATKRRLPPRPDIAAHSVANRMQTHHRTNDICTGWVLWPSAAANYRESLKIVGLVCSSQQTHGMAFHSALSIPKRTPIVVWRHRTEVWTRCDWLSCYTTVHTIIYFRLSSLHNFHSSSSSPSIASTDAP